jgi:RimJ/RimL family protein N-acetyltransferase
LGYRNCLSNFAEAVLFFERRTEVAEANKKPIFLVGKKVNLRPFSSDDISTLTRWMNDPEVREYISAILPQTEKQEEEWFNKLGKDDGNIILGIETKDGVLIGSMGIHGIKWKGDRICTTGALIGEKEYWGKGYGTDAKMVLLNYIFNELNLRKVCSAVISYNRRSLRYSLHCGYQIEGRRRKQIFKKGRFWDLIELGLFKNEWLLIWKRYSQTGKIK